MGTVEIIFLISKITFHHEQFPRIRLLESPFSSSLGILFSKIKISIAAKTVTIHFIQALKIHWVFYFLTPLGDTELLEIFTLY